MELFLIEVFYVEVEHAYLAPLEIYFSTFLTWHLDLQHNSIYIPNAVASVPK